MGLTAGKRSMEFAGRILQKYKEDQPFFYGERLVYRMEKKQSFNFHSQKDITQLFSKHFEQKIEQYEKKYYQVVTGRDSRRLIHTIKEIYGQPGEKKQLIYLFQKLGVMTREQKEWKENTKRIARHEEELSYLRRSIKEQEELCVRLKKIQEKPAGINEITREVIQNIKREIRLERLRLY